MAILKHLAIRKKDYSDIQQYLIFKCEEGTHKPLRDETGHMIQRDFFIQSGMNCNAFTFDAECVKLNHQFHKNNHKGDIMAHHFIISFDPRDAADHGLTPHKAHALAKEFAEYFFAGHQALIVTHADGNNHAGNIHTHIVINSLRKEKVEWRSFMENPRDCLPSYKHHLTDALLHRMHERLSEICEREHLYTVEIDQPTDKKVTDREYQAQRREQKESGSLAADTIKQKIRDAVDDPYAVFPDDRPRQCVFGATTNRAKCLPFDRTGNRRFLPVLVDEAQAEVHILENEAESRAYIDQMWAEAMALYRSGDYVLKFPKDIEKQLNALRREFMAEDTNAGMIQMYLDGYEGDYVCVAQIYKEALHNPFTDPSRRDSIEITDIMRHSIEGWQPGPVHRFEKYGRQRSWVRVNHVCQPSASNPQAAAPDDDGFIEVPDDPDNPFITKDEPIRMRPP